MKGSQDRQDAAKRGHAYDHDHGVAAGDDDPGADVGVIAWHRGPDL